MACIKKVVLINSWKKYIQELFKVFKTKNNFFQDSRLNTENIVWQSKINLVKIVKLINFLIDIS